jgi:HAD superfamily hydrolase (TIGR01484 family)
VHILDSIDMVALDLDGTLLNPEGDICKAAISEMIRLHEQGVYLGIATGRPFLDVSTVLCSNGITPDFGFPEFFICQERDIYFLKHDQYKPDEKNDEIFAEELKMLELSHEFIRRVDNIEVNPGFYVTNSSLQRRNGYVELLCFPVSNCIKLFNEFECLSKGTPLKPMRNGSGIKLRLKSVGKGLALERVAAGLRIVSEKILAMGDSHNDLDMLSGNFQVATTQNADDEIKDLVISKGGIISNAGYSEGVAEILQKIV